MIPKASDLKKKGVFLIFKVQHSLLVKFFTTKRSYTSLKIPPLDSSASASLYLHKVFLATSQHTVSPASLAKCSFRTVQPVSRLRLSAVQTRHYPRCVCNVIFRSHRHELTNTTHDVNQKRSLFYSVVFMSKTIVFRKRYHELKMGHFGEIRLAGPVFSAVVLPNNRQRTRKSFILKKCMR